MKRSELEHLIRAAGRIAGEREIVVIGSQAVLGQFPEAPMALLRSMEADLYPRGKPGLADKVDGAIGEGSRFHEQYGYYAQGVASDTATLPRGWQRRLVRVENANTDGYAGLCLEVHDLAICGGPGKGPRVHARARPARDDGQEDFAQAAGGNPTGGRARAGGAGKDRARLFVITPP